MVFLHFSKKLLEWFIITIIKFPILSHHSHKHLFFFVTQDPDDKKELTRPQNDSQGDIKQSIPPPPPHITTTTTTDMAIAAAAAVTTTTTTTTMISNPNLAI
jgi:hypothetical protein